MVFIIINNFFKTNMHWYRLIKDKFKQIFLDELREDYERIASDEEFKNYIVKDLDERQLMIFEGVLKYKKKENFDVLFEKYRVLAEQDRLQKKYEDVKKLNEDLLTSSSWKATENLRSLKRKIK